MLLAFVFILLIIGVGILISTYAIFVPFFDNLADITAYNVAYYGANAALERAMLITKYQDPGFVGSWGRRQDTQIGPDSDYKNNILWRLEVNSNSLIRNINSRTTQIPKPNEGNIDYLLAANDSSWYNKLDYNTRLTFLLSTDQTTIVNDFYAQESNPQIVTFGGNSIEWIFRIPPKAYQKFGNNTNAYLCDQIGRPTNCDPDEDRLHDDTIISRNLIGTHNASNANFNILPWTKVLYNKNPAEVGDGGDSNLRESDINYLLDNPDETISLLFDDTLSNNYVPFLHKSPYLITQHNIISQVEPQIANKNFTQLFEESTDIELHLWLISLLQNREGNIYPFLEYQFRFDKAIADSFYTIIAEAQVNDYKIQILVKKPTSDTSIAWDFTIIF